MLVDAIPQLAWIADPTGAIVWYNRRWYEYTGTTLDEMRGWGWQKVHHPDHLARVAQGIAHCFAVGQPWEDTFPLRGRDGAYRWFLSRALPIRDGDRIVGWLGTNTDVTDLRQVQEALLHGEERFRSLVEATSAITWTTGPDGAFSTPQSSWSRFTGRDFKTLEGTGWLDVIHPDDRAQTAEAWRRAVAEQTFYEIEHRVRRHDGEYRHMMVRAVPITDSRGRVREWFGLHIDVTERRRVEEELAAAKEMAEEVNRAKSRFIANMSHELRTPLSAVIGYTEMIAEDLADRGEDAVLEDLRKIEMNARHLLDLINSVLDISKIEAGKMEVHGEDFDAGGLVREVGETVRALVERKGNRLEIDVAGDLGRMYSDVVKVRQCLFNLLSNAAKFTENGSVSLSAERVSNRGAECIVFRVEDTGIGMSPDQLGRLFERFAQADSSTTRRFGGTGLGMAITRAFADMLGGRIEVDSREGVGTTFRLVLPADLRQKPLSAIADAVQEAVAVERGEATGEDLILVIDDERPMRDLLARFLQREGFAVALAEDGEAGLAAARDLRPRAILLDVIMPKTDGWALLARLEADPDLSRIPVIMVSAVRELGLARSLGATDYFTKPVDWQRLKRVLDRYRSGSGCTLLVVEDDPDMRAVLRAGLERDGWQVVESEDGAEALQRLASSRPSAILLDLMMPKMNGFAFLDALRRHPDWREIPVVVVTARELTPAERTRLEANVRQIVTKSDEAPEVAAEELRRVLAGLRRSIADPSPSIVAERGER